MESLDKETIDRVLIVFADVYRCHKASMELMPPGEERDRAANYNAALTVLGLRLFELFGKGKAFTLFENPSEADPCTVIGEMLINRIIESKLVTAQCVEDPSHNCLLVWSANSTEQVGAYARELGQLCFRHRPG